MSLLPWVLLLAVLVICVVGIIKAFRSFEEPPPESTVEISFAFERAFNRVTVTKTNEHMTAPSQVIHYHANDYEFLSCHLKTYCGLDLEAREGWKDEYASMVYRRMDFTSLIRVDTVLAVKLIVKFI